jgi:hypothetical protein
MKGQVAIEYMIITAIGLMIVLVGSGYLLRTFGEYSDENNISLAKNTVNKIGETSDLIFSRGSPSKIKIEITIPENVEEISFSNKTVLFRLKTSSGINSIYYSTIAQISGSLPTKSGRYYVSLTAEEDGISISVI